MSHPKSKASAGGGSLRGPRERGGALPLAPQMQMQLKSQELHLSAARHCGIPQTRVTIATESITAGFKKLWSTSEQRPPLVRTVRRKPSSCQAVKTLPGPRPCISLFKYQCQLDLCQICTLLSLACRYSGRLRPS